MSIQTVYDKHASKSPKPDFHSLKGFLSESTAYFKSGAYIILDAFDECNEYGRKALIDAIRSFISGDNQLQFFIATRPNSGIDFLTSSFADRMRRIEIIAGKGAQTQDLEQFVSDRLLKEQLGDEERSFISQRIIEKADGL